ncbi:molybdenum ABC transporter ATP-binding protein [Xaviernesmea oryzae]|uniref:Molybdenum ABC transporter ATP-binding protein n=1 Tax=Xaviernesmea oryzae TaxID=464029 RepID=A0A1Q9AZ38_9HYPH|nr:molybdenum ABC transporter ATP-binding protein [Xaviernesmea oryzae]OLP60945.1 molybdenum ABC transporter ATP-binding protein [Xaviernesmea oryzae]SEL20677.1 molybdate transport system ATP-binding protein [Xaviernesmea oryzae]
MSLDVRLKTRLGTVVLDVDFSAGDGVTALFGPSGAGKTSVLRAIAGLTTPRDGLIRLGGETLLDTAHGLSVAPHRRGFGVVFQEARLFPHLSVRRNLRFGSFFNKAKTTRAEFDHIVALLGIGPLLSRAPRHLSGGERQRVAIGRALLSAPRLLLMDEPLAALDEARRAEILPYLERLRDETRIPILYVSHSVAEVSRLADKVVLIDNGHVVGAGPAAETLSGASLLHGAPLRERGVVLEGRIATAQDEEGVTAVELGPTTRLRLAQEGLLPGSRVRLRIAARDVMLALKPVEGISALNSLPMRIVALHPRENRTMDVVLAGQEGLQLLAQITRVSAKALALSEGMEVQALIKSVALDR